MTAVFRIGQRVYWEDTDAGGVVYYANYLRFLERARSDWLRSLGLHQEAQRHNAGWIFVVSHVEARYLKPARLDDEIEISAGVHQLDRASLVFAQQIQRQGELLLDAKVRVACVDAKTFRPLRIPSDLIALLAPTP